MRLLSFIIFLSILGVQAQYSGLQFGKIDGDPDVDSLSFKQRLVYGGGGGIQFQQNLFYLNVSPSVGYRLTNTITTGVNVNTIYQSDSYYQQRFLLVGPAAFIRKRFFNYFFLQTEAEILYTRRTLNFKSVDPIVDNRFLPGVLVGGGIVTAPGQGTVTTIALMYNIFYDEFFNPLRNPQFRIGISVGF